MKRISRILLIFFITFLVLSILITAPPNSGAAPCNTYRTREEANMPNLNADNWTKVKIVRSARILHVYQDKTRPDLSVAAIRSISTIGEEWKRVVLLWEIGDERYMTRPANKEDGVCVNYIDRNMKPALDLSNYIKGEERFVQRNR